MVIDSNSDKHHGSFDWRMMESRRRMSPQFFVMTILGDMYGITGTRNMDYANRRKTPHP